MLDDMIEAFGGDSDGPENQNDTLSTVKTGLREQSIVIRKSVAGENGGKVDVRLKR